MVMVVVVVLLLLLSLTLVVVIPAIPSLTSRAVSCYHALLFGAHSINRNVYCFGITTLTCGVLQEILHKEVAGANAGATGRKVKAVDSCPLPPPPQKRPRPTKRQVLFTCRRTVLGCLL